MFAAGYTIKPSVPSNPQPSFTDRFMENLQPKAPSAFEAAPTPQVSAPLKPTPSRAPTTLAPAAGAMQLMLFAYALPLALAEAHPEWVEQSRVAHQDPMWRVHHAYAYGWEASLRNMREAQESRVQTNAERHQAELEQAWPQYEMLEFLHDLHEDHLQRLQFTQALASQAMLAAKSAQAAAGLNQGALGVQMSAEGNVSVPRSFSHPWTREEFEEEYLKHCFRGQEFSKVSEFGLSMDYLINANVGELYFYNWLGLDNIPAEQWLTIRFTRNLSTLFDIWHTLSVEPRIGHMDASLLIALGPDVLRHLLVETDLETSELARAWASTFTPNDFYVDYSYRTDGPRVDNDISFRMDLNSAGVVSDAKESILLKWIQELEAIGKTVEAGEVRQTLYALIMGREYDRFLLAQSLEEDLNNLFKRGPFQSVTFFSENFSDSLSQILQLVLRGFFNSKARNDHTIEPVTSARFGLEDAHRQGNGIRIAEAELRFITSRNDVAANILGFVPKDFHLINEAEHIAFVLSHDDFVRAKYNLSQQNKTQKDERRQDVWHRLTERERKDYAEKNCAVGLAYKSGISLVDRDNSSFSIREIYAHEQQHQGDFIVREILKLSPFYTHSSDSADSNVGESFWTETGALLAQNLVGGTFPALNFFGPTVYDPLSPEYREGSADPRLADPKYMSFYDEMRRMGTRMRSDFQAIIRKLDALKADEKTTIEELDKRYYEIKRTMLSYFRIGIPFYQSPMMALEAWLNFQFDGKFGQVQQLPRDVTPDVPERVIHELFARVKIALLSSDFYSDITIRDRFTDQTLAKMSVIYYKNSYYIRALQPNLEIDGKAFSQKEYVQLPAGSNVNLSVKGRVLKVRLEKVEE